jgi:hypothetical protein
VTSAPTSCSGLAPPRPSAPCSRRGEDWAAIARATSSPASRRIHHRSGWAAGALPSTQAASDPCGMTDRTLSTCATGSRWSLAGFRHRMPGGVLRPRDH